MHRLHRLYVALLCKAIGKRSICPTFYALPADDEQELDDFVDNAKIILDCRNTLVHYHPNRPYKHKLSAEEMKKVDSSWKELRELLDSGQIKGLSLNGDIMTRFTQLQAEFSPKPVWRATPSGLKLVKFGDASS